MCAVQLLLLLNYLSQFIYRTLISCFSQFSPEADQNREDSLCLVYQIPDLEEMSLANLSSSLSNEAYTSSIVDVGTPRKSKECEPQDLNTPVGAVDVPCETVEVPGAGGSSGGSCHSSPETGSKLG